MKTQLHNWMLLALLTCGLSMSFAACSDDDDDKEKNEQPAGGVNALDNDEADAAWRWLCQLSDVQTLSADWASKTYEPTVGEPSEQNQTTRIVVVNDLDEAKSLFANLADVTTDKLSQTYTAQQAGVGTLTWTPSAANAQNLAEVEVDTKLIPSLQRIVYCTEEQRGQNGLFSKNVDGTTYYRMGDIIADRDGYYWICVRPAFKQGDKGKSHWMNIINASETGRKYLESELCPIPTENINNKYDNLTKYANRTIILPTNLAYSREHMNNLTNLIWALLNPEQHKTNVGNVDGKKNGLGGFDYNYHGETFLKNVAAYWDEPLNELDEKLMTWKNPNRYNLWQLIFNRTREQMNAAQNLTLYYKGYQWRVGRTGYLFEFSSPKGSFNLKTPGSESGDKKLHEFADNGFDIRRYTSDPEAAETNATMTGQFHNGTYHYVVRYKTGDQLSVTGNTTPYEKIEGCVNVYRYNAKKNVGVHAALETEKGPESVGEALSKPVVGCLVADDGNFYADALECSKCGVKPVALVVHYGEKGSVEANTDYRGLAIALKKFTNTRNEMRFLLATAKCNCQKTIMNRNYQNATAILDGIKSTQTLAEHNQQPDHNHQAASECWNYDPMKEGVRDQKHFSHWFLGSIGQWILVNKGLGYTWNPIGGLFKGEGAGLANRYYDGLFYLAGITDSDMTTDVSGAGLAADYTYWGSTYEEEDKICNIHYMSNGSIFLKSYDLEDNSPQYIRPLIAF